MIPHQAHHYRTLYCKSRFQSLTFAKMILTLLLLVTGGASTAFSLPRSLVPYSTPGLNNSARTVEIEATRQGFTYGVDDTLVRVDPWPAGPLGRDTIDQHYQDYGNQQLRIQQLVEQDVANFTAQMNRVCPCVGVLRTICEFSNLEPLDNSPELI